MWPLKSVCSLFFLSIFSSAATWGAEGAVPPVRHPIEDRVFYFVLPDRFENGRPENDRGDQAGDALTHGFLPTAKAYYHGGDLAGLTQRLDYLQQLGVTALWMTPIARNQSVQGAGGLSDSSAGYHGYWVSDFLRVDPHLGNEADLKNLIDAAHARGIQVYFDIIVNHTADVIAYAGGKYTYRSKKEAPYRNAQGQPFDEGAFAGRADFPELDASVSFPHTPVFRHETDAHLKNPDWLNNPIYYHNRGNSFFEGESATLGDFSGLDDLFTEHPRVREGMVGIYRDWIRRFDVDGFRIDTVKHVEMSFWQDFSPAIFQTAREMGRPDFFMFGEVYDHNPAVMSRYSTQGGLSATLDFGFQRAVRAYATGQGSASDLRDLFEADDYYTSATRNAQSLPTFLGNHDMGRIAYFIEHEAGAREAATWVQRDVLAHALMFFARGVPVIYYGDEQGLAGKGGDQDARQDLFATQVADYANEHNLGGEAGARARFDVEHPLYVEIQKLAQLRQAHPSLRHGAHINRYASRGDGVYAFSRMDRDEQREYLVLANNSDEAQAVTVPTSSPQTEFFALYGGEVGRILRTDERAQITVQVPPLSVLLYRARTVVPPSAAPPELTLAQPFVTPDQRILLQASLKHPQWVEVSFAVKVGHGAFEHVGTDTDAPYRVFWTPPQLSPGTPLTVQATVYDLNGHTAQTQAVWPYGP